MQAQTSTLSSQAYSSGCTIGSSVCRMYYSTNRRSRLKALVATGTACVSLMHPIKHPLMSLQLRKDSLQRRTRNCNTLWRLTTSDCPPSVRSRSSIHSSCDREFDEWSSLSIPDKPAKEERRCERQRVDLATSCNGQQRPGKQTVGSGGK
jgi:hypothetical protein